jgi:hypothetical protein
MFFDKIEKFLHLLMMIAGTEEPLFCLLEDGEPLQSNLFCICLVSRSSKIAKDGKPQLHQLTLLRKLFRSRVIWMVPHLLFKSSSVEGAGKDEIFEVRRNFFYSEDIRPRAGGRR